MWLPLAHNFLRDNFLRRLEVCTNLPHQSARTCLLLRPILCMPTVKAFPAKLLLLHLVVIVDRIPVQCSYMYMSEHIEQY